MVPCLDASWEAVRCQDRHVYCGFLACEEHFTVKARCWGRPLSEAGEFYVSRGTLELERGHPYSCARTRWREESCQKFCQKLLTPESPRASVARVSKIISVSIWRCHARFAGSRLVAVPERWAPSAAASSMAFIA